MHRVPGLSAGQERIYRYLLTEGFTSHNDLVKRLGPEVDEDLVDDDLWVLRERGLVHSDPPVARRPSRALQGDLLEREAQLRELMSYVDELDELFDANNSPVDGHPVEVLSTLDSIQQYFEHIHATARHEVMQIVTHPFMPLSPPSGPAMSADADEDHPAKCRVIYEQRVFDNAAAVAGLTHSVERGCEIRLADRLPHKLLIGDRALAMTPRYPRGHHDSRPMLLVHPGTLMDFLVMVFETEWDQALPMQTDPGQFTENGRDLDTQEMLIVEMLSGGAHVERIASALGVHKRTVERKVGELKQRAGVETLFQLGTHAGRHWLR
ncbi:hypothetical protein [Streptosporangium sp. OZ121]|uniref:hypothetical protein n=1 Tax=Streptosporangium sp. OZ121 TaxID=3444183 RepID=UPI003F7AA722